MAYQIPSFNQPSRQPAGTVNPLDEILASDPQASAVWRQVSKDYTTVYDAFGQLSTLADNTRRLVDQINTDDSRTMGYKQEQVMRTRAAAQQAYEAIYRGATDARANVLNVVNGLLDPSGFVKGSTAADTQTFLMRTQDAWDRRLKPILQSVDTTVSGNVWDRALRLAKEAAERDDTFAMSALRQYLEAHMESIGQKMPRQQIVSQLNVAMAPASSPQMRAAMQIQQTLEIGWNNLTAAFQATQRTIKEKNSFQVSGLPGFPGQPPITI